MRRRIFFLAAIAALALVSGHAEDSLDAAGAQTSSTMSFFVSSAKSKTGNLGGPRGADRICRLLASAVGLGNKTWRAYLSVERDPDNNNKPTDARSRIGTGPWSNAMASWLQRILPSCTPAKGRSTCLSTSTAKRSRQLAGITKTRRA